MSRKSAKLQAGTTAMPTSAYRIRRFPRGVATIKVLLALPAVIMLSWLGIEFALVLRAANQAKIAADAIALSAAARFIDGFDAAKDDALDAAAGSVGPNGPVVIEVGSGPAGGGDLEFGIWDEDSRTFVSSPDGGPAVRARVRFASDSPNGAPGIVLAGLFDLTDVAVERSSVAVFTPPRHATALQLIGPGAGRLELSVSARCESRNGISILSTDPQAAIFSGSSALETPVLRIAGSLSSASAALVYGLIETGSTLDPDAFAAVPLPPLNAASATAIAHAAGATTYVAPGVHSRLEYSSGKVVLTPGLHQFTGSIVMNGTAQLELDGASLHLSEAASIEISDSATIMGTPADGIGAWSGAWALQRAPLSLWRVGGNAEIDVDGLLYAPSTRFNASGAAVLTLDAAVLRRYFGAGTSSLVLDAKIEALDQAVVPGRARLVR